MKKAILSAALLLSFSAAWAGPRTMATVNGKAITSDELTKRLWWQHSAQGLSDLVDERLLLDEAARLKAQPDENEVQTRFARLQANYKDKTEFEKSLKSVNWTVADLMNLLRNQVLIKNTIIASKKLAVTDEDARTRRASARRSPPGFFRSSSNPKPTPTTPTWHFRPGRISPNCPPSNPQTII